MFTLTNSLQAAIQGIIFVLLGYMSYTYFSSKREHSKLFGMGLLLLALSYASWACATLLWTNPFIEYLNLSYILQIASIFVFLGCGIYLAPHKYQKILNYVLIAVAVISAGYLVINPLLNGAFIYSLRYYLSFQNQTTITVFAIIMALSLIFASFAVNSREKVMFELNLKNVLFILLALSLALGFTAYNDTLRNINSIALLVITIILTVTHVRLSTKAE